MSSALSVKGSAIAACAAWMNLSPMSAAVTISKYCARCNSIQPLTHTHRAPDTRPSARKRGYDARWERTRSAFLAAHPICSDPSGCISPATDVDHIKAKRDGGTDDWSNLRALCHSHHSQRTARDQAGGWNAQA